MEKQKSSRSRGPSCMAYLAVLVLVAVTVVIVLALTGPRIGNIFSNVSKGLSRGGGGGGGGSVYVAPPASNAVSVAVQPTAIPHGIFQDYGVNPMEDTANDNLSTFAMDVDTASYTVARSYLNSRQMPPQEAIRPEEFINYLPTRYAPPNDGRAFAIHLDAAPSPFVAQGNLLLRVGIQGQQIPASERDPATLIFVIDVSGSMNSPERLGMVKETLKLLVPQLREDDRVGIVIYANAARIVLRPTPTSEQQTILNAIAGLYSEGSTYAEAGLTLGYEVARQNMQPNGTTRVILLSDGVANVGETGPDRILQIIKQGVDAGVTLSTIGFGMGTYNDVLMEQLANDGNGNYFYVDNLREARRVFVNNLTSTLQVIGYDAKIQVAFNADAVSAYRLIGYENRAVADADFRNDKVDAGEVGAGHSVTALYEITLTPGANGPLVLAQIHYEDATTRQVIEQNDSIAVSAISGSFADMPTDFRLHAASAELAELLRGNVSVSKQNFQTVIEVIQPLASTDATAAELLLMAQTAQQLTP